MKRSEHPILNVHDDYMSTIFINPYRFESGGGGGGITLVAHAKGPGGLLNDTAGPINTTGATFIILSVSSFQDGGTVGISDSLSNTWTPLTVQATGEVKVRLYYCYAPIVGAAHTFTAGGAFTAGTIFVAAFSGLTTAFDVQNGATSGATAATIQPGAVTPGVASELIVSALVFNNNAAGVISIDSGFTITDSGPYTSGITEGGSMAYKVVSSVSAENPTWNTANTCSKRGAVIATFS